MDRMDARKERIVIGLLTFTGEKLSPNHVWSVNILGPSVGGRGYVLANFTLGDDEWASLVEAATIE